MLATGTPAPPFRLGGFSLAEAAGPVLLAFFKITCPTCQLTFPFLQRLAERTGLRVVGISQDNEEDTAEFNSALGVKFETVPDPANEGYRVSNAYEIEYVPTLFLIGLDGRIEWVRESFSKPDLEALAARWGAALFEPSDRVPVYKPG